MNKNTYIHNILNESIEEVSSNFKDFADYKRGIARGGNIFVYHNTSKDAIPNIKENGAEGSKEFFNTMCYGRGMYTLLDYKNACGAVGGDAVIKFIVKKGAFDNFLIFGDDIRQHLNSLHAISPKYANETLDDTLKRLLGNQYQTLVNDGYYKGSRGYSGSNAILNALGRGEGNIQLRKGKTFASELNMDRTNVDGFCYHGYGGIVCLFRTSDLVIPYKYYIRNGGRGGSWPSENEGSYCINNDNDFNKVHYTIDGFRRGRKDYPETNFTTKSIHGLSIVGKKGHYNLMNVRTGKYFSPEPFDDVSKNAVNGTFVLTFKNQDIGTGPGDLLFQVKSNNFAENFAMKFQFVAKGEKPVDWNTVEPNITYDQFVGLFGGQLNESVDEVFTHKTKDEFNKSVKDGKYEFVYTCSSHNNIKSIMQNGLSAEFLGTNPNDTSIYYGVGAYCTYDLESSKKNLGTYGDTIFKFALKDGFKNFLIFDGEARQKYDPGHSVYDEIIRLVPQEYLQKLEDYTKNNGAIGMSYRQKGLHYYDTSPSYPQSSGPLAKNFYEALKGGKKGKINYAEYYAEEAIAKSRVRGYLYHGNINPRSAFIRDFNALMPVAFSTDGGRTWQDNPYLDDDTFDFLNQNVNPYYQYRGEYNDVGIKDKQTCGFSVVKGKQGYNYKDIWLHKYLLPIDVDKAGKFNPTTMKAEFSLMGITFKIKIEEDGSLSLFYVAQGNEMECPYDMFMGLVNAGKQQGKLDHHPHIYDGNLLNPANQQHLKDIVAKKFASQHKMVSESILKEAPESLAIKLNRLREAEEYFNSIGLSLFKDPNVITVVTSNETLSELQKAKKQIRALVDFVYDDLYEYYANDDAQNFVKNLLLGERNSDNTYSPKIAGKDLQSRKDAQIVRDEARKSEQQKQIDARKQAKENICNDLYQDYNLDYFNFYINFKGGELPIEMSGTTPKENNQELKPYAEQDSEFQLYMKIKNVCAEKGYVFNGVSIGCIKPTKVKQNKYGEAIFPISPKDSSKKLVPNGWVDLRKFVKSLGFTPSCAKVTGDAKYPLLIFDINRN